MNSELKKKRRRCLTLKEIDLINKDFFFSIDLFSLSKQILLLIRFKKTFEQIFYQNLSKETFV
jgi:hypothetical protein